MFKSTAKKVFDYISGLFPQENFLNIKDDIPNLERDIFTPPRILTKKNKTYYTKDSLSIINPYIYKDEYDHEQKGTILRHMMSFSDDDEKEPPFQHQNIKTEIDTKEDSYIGEEIVSEQVIENSYDYVDELFDNENINNKPEESDNDLKTSVESDNDESDDEDFDKDKIQIYNDIYGDPLNVWMIKKCPEIIKILEGYYSDDTNFFIHSSYQTWKSLIIQLIAIRYACDGHQVLIILDASTHQAETFLLRWIELRASIINEIQNLADDIPIPLFTGDLPTNPTREKFPKINTSVMVALRNGPSLKKVRALKDEINGEERIMLIMNDESHMIEKTEKSDYIKIFNEMIEEDDSILQFNVSATQQYALYSDKSNAKDLNCHSFYSINPPSDHHGLESVNWITNDTPNNWESLKTTDDTINSIDPTFDKHYKPLLKISKKQAQERVIYDKRDKSHNNRILNYPYNCLYTVCTKIEQMNTVFDHVKTKYGKRTAVITYNSDQIKMYIPNINSDTITFQSIERISKNNKIIGVRRKFETVQVDRNGNFNISSKVNIQDVYTFLCDTILHGKYIQNIFTIAGPKAKQGQSYCSRERVLLFPEGKNELYFDKDFIAYSDPQTFKIELSHIRVLKDTDCCAITQVIGRIAGRSFIGMERTVSTTEEIKNSIKESERRQLSDFKRAAEGDKFALMRDIIMSNLERKSLKPSIKMITGKMLEIYNIPDDDVKENNEKLGLTRIVNEKTINKTTIMYEIYKAAKDAYNALKEEDGEWISRPNLVEWIINNKDNYARAKDLHQISGHLRSIYQTKTINCNNENKKGFIIRKTGLSDKDTLYIRFNN